MKRILTIFLFVFLIVNPLKSQIQTIANTQPSEMTAEKWKQDMHFMVDHMDKIHLNVFHTMTREQLSSFVNEFDTKVSKLSDNQTMIEFLKLITMIGDGHTYMLPESFHLFPVRLYKFEDGVFVIGAHGENSNLMGNRLVSIGNKSWEEIEELLKGIIPRDNDMWIGSVGPTYAVIAEFLNGLAVIDDIETADFVFEDNNKNHKTVKINSRQSTREEFFQMDHFGDEANASLPLYRQNPERYYWLEYLPEQKLLFIKYNVVQFDPNESMKKFCERIEEIVNTKEVDKIVIDVRDNGGGNNFTSIPFSDFLSNNEKINVYGKLYTVIGRKTFSAASFFTSSMENKTNTIFIGEPTGATPNHYGDNRPLKLPNSGLQPRFSTIYWQNSFPSDKRKSTEPDIEVKLTSEEYFTKRDPVLEAIVDHRAPALQISKPDESAMKFAGRYEFSPDQVLTIKENNGNLNLEITNFYKTILNPESKYQFGTSRKNVNVSFDETKNGEEVIIALSGNKHSYKRLPENKFLASELLEMNKVPEAVAVLRELKTEHPERRSVSEVNMNILGYELINQHKLDAAIEIFKLNVEFYPDAFNTYDSLGEAYMMAGKKELAKVNYEKSYELNPKNENAKKIIEELK